MPGRLQAIRGGSRRQSELPSLLSTQEVRRRTGRKMKANNRRTAKRTQGDRSNPTRRPLLQQPDVVGCRERGNLSVGACQPLLKGERSMRHGCGPKMLQPYNSKSGKDTTQKQKKVEGRKKAKRGGKLRQQEDTFPRETKEILFQRRHLLPHHRVVPEETSD
jgi:hypothetical protein